MRAYTCILCPNGCEITPSDEGGATVFSGAACDRGGRYVLQEMTDPKRTISSLAPVDGGDRPLVGVRLTAAVPRNRIDDVMREVKRLRLQAPVTAGQVLMADVLGLGSDIIAIDNVPE